VCLNILNSDKSLEIIENTISRDENFLEHGYDDEDTILVENISVFKAEMVKLHGKN
jgi:hypothetical protein